MPYLLQKKKKKKKKRARAHTHTHTIYTFFFLKRKYPDLFTKKQLVTDSSHTFFAFPPASDDDALCEGCEWSDSFFTINVQSLKAGHTWAKKVNKWKIKTQNKDLLNGLQQMRKFSVETLQANWRLYTKKLALSLQTSLPADGKPGQILFYWVIACYYIVFLLLEKGDLKHTSCLITFGMFWPCFRTLAVKLPFQISPPPTPPSNEWKVNCSRNTSLCLKRIRKKKNEWPAPSTTTNKK